MSLQIYDFHREEDIRNILVTPQIRSRFARMEPGEVASYHSHDLGHEIFLILQGRAIFEIDGEEAELEPGQMCLALTDQVHQVRAVGDEPMIMYLSVTPHIQPTHTGRTPEGERMPTHFSPNSSYGVGLDTEAPVEELIERYSGMARNAAETIRESADRVEGLKEALAAGDEEAASEVRDAVWKELYQSFKQIYELGDVWNELAPRATETKGS